MKLPGLEKYLCSTFLFPIGEAQGNLNESKDKTVIKIKTVNLKKRNASEISSKGKKLKLKTQKLNPQSRNCSL